MPSNIGFQLNAFQEDPYASGAGALPSLEAFGTPRIAQPRNPVATLVWDSNGFEAGTALSTYFFTTGGAPIIDTAVSKNGQNSFKVSGDPSWGRKSLPAGQKVAVARFYIKLDTLPSAGIELATLGGFRLGYDSTHQSFGVIAGTSQDFTGNHSAAISAGRWYLIDMRADQSASTWVLDWQIDRVAQTQLAFVNPAANVSDIYLGHTTGFPVSVTAHYDDAVVSNTWADYPIGAPALPITPAGIPAPTISTFLTPWAQADAFGVIGLNRTGTTPKTIYPAGIPVASGWGDDWGDNWGGGGRFGTARAVFVTRPPGLASVTAFGTPTRVVIPAGVSATGHIASLEAFGTAHVLIVVRSTGLASKETFGIAHPTRIVRNTGALGSAEAFGTPTRVVPGLILSAGQIASLEAFGAATILGGVAPPAPSLPARLFIGDGGLVVLAYGDQPLSAARMADGAAAIAQADAAVAAAVVDGQLGLLIVTDRVTSLPRVFMSDASLASLLTADLTGAVTLSDAALVVSLSELVGVRLAPLDTSATLNVVA